MDGYMEQDDIIELTDEEGNVVKFAHVMTVEYKNDNYVLLDPVEKMDDFEEGEVLILKIDRDKETGEDIYVTVEDDNVLEKVFEKYLEIVENEEDDE